MSGTVNMTLASLLAPLERADRLFIVHRLGPHECEAVAEGTVEELRASRCVEVCGENAVVALSLELDDISGAPIPVMLVTIGEKEAEV
jgi:hypothetical protein